VRRNTSRIIASAFLVQGVLLCPARQARAEADPYPAIAPLQEYLMPKDAEIALARSAAPASIADGATVMVLGRQGYTTVVQGTNGFLCYVERSWANTTDKPEFWNPKMRAPNCFNAAAASSVAPIYLMKTRLVLAGKSKAEIAQAIAAALDSGELSALAPGGMCYMMSKEQYLNDQGHSCLIRQDVDRLRPQSVSAYPTCAPLGSLTSPSITTVGTQWYGKTRVVRHVLPKLSRCGASHVN
jgi:hypothetical protein